MPRCDGIPPDGRCPHNAVGRNVKPSQGELMLCSACDATRFPKAQRSTSNVLSESSGKRQVNKKKSDDKQHHPASVTATPVSDTKSKLSNINCRLF